MGIPMTDLKAQYRRYQKELDGAILGIVNAAAFILGKGAEEFEKAFAAYCGVTHCLGVGNGTDAIGLALEALGVERGDEVITTPFTFIATVEGIVERGATPRFVDIDPETYCLDAAKLAAAISSRTRAVVPVHLYGQLCAMPAILAVARQHGLKVMEDAAQAHGAQLQGKRAGSWGDAATFSFYPGKNLGAYGDAGAMVTKDRTVAERVRLLRNHGRVAKYNHDCLGRNSRLDGIQGAVLAVKLKHLDDWNRTRLARARRYNEALADLGRRRGVEIICPRLPEDGSHVVHLYTIRTPRRDALADHLKKQGIECAVHYPMALHQQPALAHLKIAAGSLPEAERAGREVLSLPLCPELTESNQQQVIDGIAGFFS